MRARVVPSETGPSGRPLIFPVGAAQENRFEPAEMDVVVGPLGVAPVTMLEVPGETVGTATEDIRRSYRLGANSCIAKPVTHAHLVDVMRDLAKYWFDVVELPQ